MHTFFLSDLHLEPERPELVVAFLTFLQHQAPSAERVYVLGDLFEYWIGDDAAQMVGAEPVLAAMKAASQQTECFFIAGNRDFLVGEQFEQASGFKILPDETIIDLYGTPTLILHGDSLCTDDVAHMKFRQEIVTNSERKSELLSLPIPARIELAKSARMESNKHKSTISMEIMDVSQPAVERSFKQNNVQQMIHGHTHRQHTHQHPNGCTRHVLGDWHTTTSIMTATADGLTINNTPLAA